MKRILLALSFALIFGLNAEAFDVKAVYVDHRTQVQTISSLKNFAKRAAEGGMNAIVMEWEATFPFEENATLCNRFAFSKNEIREISEYCNGYVVNRDKNISYKEYLCDAAFLVGLESDDEELLCNIAYAIENPKFHIYLGRKCCPPEYPVLLKTEEHMCGITDRPLYDALYDEPYIGSDYSLERRLKKGNVVMEIMMDGKMDDNGRLVKDFPISFSTDKRQYTHRKIKICAPKIIMAEKEGQAEHDAFSEAVQDGFMNTESAAEPEHDVFADAENA